MKKKLTLMLAFIFGLFCLVSCGGNNENNNDNPNNGDTGNTDKPGDGEQNTQKPEEKDEYQVKVLYPDGTPATSATKIKVQVCTTAGCQFPVAIDNTGVAVLEDLADDTYFVHLQNVPAGYTYNPNLTIKPEAKKLDINLLKITTPTVGEGTQAAPYEMTMGTYTVNCTKVQDLKYFKFTPTEAGSYMIESLVQAVQSSTVLVPVLIDNTDPENRQQTEFGNNKNFNYTLNAEANKTYLLVFTLYTNTVFEDGNASFNFTVSKLA